MTPFSQSLAISQRHGEKHIQAFDNFLSKCISTSRNGLNVCAKLRIPSIWSIKPRISRRKFFDTSADKFTSLFDRNASTLSARVQLFAGSCERISARKYFLPVGYEGVDVSPLVVTIDKEVISNEVISDSFGRESWHELFLHTRLPFYPPQRLPYHATTIIFSTSRHYLALVTKGDER